MVSTRLFPFLFLLGARAFTVLVHHERQRLSIQLAVSETNNGNSASRRNFVSSIVVLGSAVATLRPKAAMAEAELIDVYFGCGCFWHVQHELVEAERKILGRTDDQLTARTGYAGGKSGAGVGGKVCYHNAANTADYGTLGHAEIVSLRIPSSKIEEFAVEYFRLFNDGLRPDQFGDRGTEYRNLVGLPGGSKSPYAQSLISAIKATGDQLDLAVGKGDDKDIPKLVYVMDTASYPAFIGEQYHQFHDGFNLGENYPNSYNSLASKFAKAGENFGSCPNGMLGVGVGGL